MYGGDVIFNIKIMDDGSATIDKFVDHAISNLKKLGNSSEREYARMRSALQKNLEIYRTYAAERKRIEKEIADAMAQKDIKTLSQLSKSFESITKKYEAVTNKINKLTDRMAEHKIRTWEKTLRSLTEKFSNFASKASYFLYNKLTSYLKMAVVSATGAVTAIVYKGAELEQAIASIGAISERFGEDLRDDLLLIEAKLRDIQQQTIYTGTTAADAMYKLAQAGLTTQEAIDALLPSLYLSGATGADLELTTNLLASSMKAFGSEARYAGYFADIFGKAITASLLDMSRLSEAMKYAAPTAGALGQSLETTVAALAEFVDLGLRGETAGTTFRNALIKMAQATKIQRNILKQLNLTLADVNPTTNDFIDLVNKLAQSGMTAMQAFLFFGLRAGPSMAKIITEVRKTGKQFGEFKNLLVSSALTVEEMYKRATDNVLDQAKMLKNTFYETAIIIYSVFKEPLKKMIIDLREELRKFNRGLMTNNESMIKGILEWFGIFRNIINWIPKNIDTIKSAVHSLMIILGGAIGMLIGIPFGPAAAGILGLAGATTGFALSLERVKWLLNITFKDDKKLTLQKQLEQMNAELEKFIEKSEYISKENILDKTKLPEIIANMPTAEAAELVDILSRIKQVEEELFELTPEAQIAKVKESFAKLTTKFEEIEEKQSKLTEKFTVMKNKLQDLDIDIDMADLQRIDELMKRFYDITYKVPEVSKAAEPYRKLAQEITDAFSNMPITTENLNKILSAYFRIDIDTIETKLQSLGLKAIVEDFTKRITDLEKIEKTEYESLIEPYENMINDLKTLLEEEKPLENWIKGQIAKVDVLKTAAVQKRFEDMTKDLKIEPELNIEKIIMKWSEKKEELQRMFGLAPIDITSKISLIDDLKKTEMEKELKRLFESLPTANIKLLQIDESELEKFDLYIKEYKRYAQEILLTEDQVNNHIKNITDLKTQYIMASFDKIIADIDITIDEYSESWENLTKRISNFYNETLSIATEAEKKWREGLITTEEYLYIFDQINNKQMAFNRNIAMANPLAKRLSNTFTQSVSMTIETFSDQLVRGFEGGKKAWKELGREILSLLVQAILKAIILDQIMKNMSFGGGGGGLISGIGKIFSGIFGSLFHEGGYIPRYHPGGVIKPDEVPALLQRGEMVINARETEALGGRYFANMANSGLLRDVLIAYANLKNIPIYKPIQSIQQNQTDRLLKDILISINKKDQPVVYTTVLSPSIKIEANTQDYKETAKLIYKELLKMSQEGYKISTMRGIRV